MSTWPIFWPCSIFRPPAPSSDLPGLKTSAPTSDQGLVGRWGRPVLRPGRSKDRAQHIYFSVFQGILYLAMIQLKRWYSTNACHNKKNQNIILLDQTFPVCMRFSYPCTQNICHGNLSWWGLLVLLVPSNPLASSVGALGIDEIGTDVQLSRECWSMCLSNSWFMHAQSMTRSGPAPIKSINTWALRAQETGFCWSGSTRSASPKTQSSDLVTRFARSSCSGLVGAPLTIS